VSVPIVGAGCISGLVLMPSPVVALIVAVAGEEGGP